MNGPDAARKFERIMEVALAHCCRCRASGTRIIRVLAASKRGATMADLKTIRTDVIGSLLRPPGLREARIRFDNGQLTAEALRVVEDEAVRGAVRLQESVGLDVVTDGEMRRLNFQDSFGAAVERFDYENSRGVYQGLDDFVDDVVKIERAIVQSLVKAGCRYIHIDAPGFTAYVDEPSMAQMRARGEDPMENFARSLEAESKVVASLGDDVTTGIHLCRGNQRSMWHREGTYDAIAERLFNELAHDRFMLEYDSPRAGSFEPLRFVPTGKVVVLGLISTKTPDMETVDGLKRRIDEASKFVPLEQLAISPQCGFASDVVGNLISADDQKRKLELLVETARQVWG